ncbi:MAG: lysostaphin resistance A-like protein [Lepagella sp.]
MTQDISNKYKVFSSGFGSRIGVLFFAFFAMFLIVGFVGQLLHHLTGDSRNYILLTSALQALIIFCVPTLLSAWLCDNDPVDYVGLRFDLKWRHLFGVVIIMLITSPMMNMLIEWNANITLPDSLSSLAAKMKEMEDMASATTDTLLGETSIYALLSGILVIGILTGIGEEMFFRGGIQRILASAGMNPHLAIWLAAFLFSAMHLQFFGFFPRMLLGAFFGYLYYSTRSIWVPALAHALNNSIVVVNSWLITTGYASDSYSEFSESSPELYMVVISAIVTLIFIPLCWRRFFNHPPHLPKCRDQISNVQ